MILFSIPLTPVALGIRFIVSRVSSGCEDVKNHRLRVTQQTRSLDIIFGHLVSVFFKGKEKTEAKKIMKKKKKKKKKKKGKKKVTTNATQRE